MSLSITRKSSIHLKLSTKCAAYDLLAINVALTYLAQIPTLDTRNFPDTFPDRALVRFRAMVQDTSASSEMYLSKSKSGACGGWGIDFDEEGDARVNFGDLRECTVLWAISVPTESAWCAKELDGPVERMFALSAR